LNLFGGKFAGEFDLKFLAIKNYHCFPLVERKGLESNFIKM
jgi:hypothetical protein